MSPARLAAATLLSATTLPALAASQLTLHGSQALISVDAFVGTAIVDAQLPCGSGDTVELCDYSGLLALPDTETARTTPGTTGIAGSGWAHAEESQWTADMTLTWATGQSFALGAVGGDTVLSASGHHESTLGWAVSGPGAFPSRLVTVRHHQRIAFSLDASTAFTMDGLVYGEYMPIQLYQADAAGDYQLIGSWCPYAGEACSASGTLAAGDYAVQVFEWANSDDNAHYSFGWDYSFRFADTVSAVPEPGTLALFALGLAAVGARRRRQAA